MLTFQWQANGVNITLDATSGSFAPMARSSARPLTVTVTGTKPGIPAVVRTSAVSERSTPARRPCSRRRRSPARRRARLGEHRRPGHLGHRDHAGPTSGTPTARDRRRHGDDVHADDLADRPGADLRGHQHPPRLHDGGRRPARGKTILGAGPDAAADADDQRHAKVGLTAHRRAGDLGRRHRARPTSGSRTAIAIESAPRLTYDLDAGRARQGDHLQGHQHQAHLRDGHQGASGRPQRWLPATLTVTPAPDDRRRAPGRRAR